MRLVSPLKCKRCGYEWEYRGRSEWYACCPRCRSQIRVRRSAQGKVKGKEGEGGK